MESKDQVAIVTGASSGVGKAISDKLASNGYNLVLAARRVEILEEMANGFSNKYGVKALPVKTDLTIYEEIESLFRKTEEEFGRLDLLVNVAGSFPDVSFVESSPEEFSKIYERSRRLMQDAVIYASKLGLKMLMENNGSIINISSDAGLEKKVYPNQLPYLAAKAAVNHASRGMDLESKEKGTRVFALAPGNIDTPLLRKAIENSKEVKVLIEKKAGSLDNFYNRILKPQGIADKVLDIVKNRDGYQDSVIEMESYEF